jgi:uncharacterized protein
MENFTPLSGAVGGVLIGIGALALLFFNERIAGISGIYSGLVKMRPNETLWRFLFVLGLLLGGTIVKVFHPAAFDLQIDKREACLWDSAPPTATDAPAATASAASAACR